MNTKKTSGFSLVELSIVLVILGLLVGGVLSGRSLIRAAELRNITVEHQQFETALNTFRQKYNALPGDFNKATQFWGDVASPPTPAKGTETRNGNGNGSVDTGERWRYWQHLSNAGLVEGRYAEAPVDPDAPVAGTDMPASKLGGAAWWLWSGRSAKGEGLSNIWVLAPAGDYQPRGAMLTPEELWGVDNKMDDGQPTTGIVQAGFRNTACVNEATTPVSYQLSQSAATCNASFPRSEPATGWACQWSDTNGPSFC